MTPSPKRIKAWQKVLVEILWLLKNETGKDASMFWHKMFDSKIHRLTILLPSKTMRGVRKN